MNDLYFSIFNHLGEIFRRHRLLADSNFSQNLFRPVRGALSLNFYHSSNRFYHFSTGRLDNLFLHHWIPLLFLIDFPYIICKYTSENNFPQHLLYFCCINNNFSQTRFDLISSNVLTLSFTNSCMIYCKNGRLYLLSIWLSHLPLYFS